MDSNDSRRAFKQAEELFASGQYGDALELLTNLDRQYPNTKNLLYPKALCLEKLGRHSDAHDIARRLSTEFEDPRAKALLTRLALAGPADVDLMSVWDDVHQPSMSPSSAPPTPPHTSLLDYEDWPVWLPVSAAVAFVAALIFFAGWLQSTVIPADESSNVIEDAVRIATFQFDEITPAVLLLAGIYLVLDYGLLCVSLFLALMLTGFLPQGDIVEQITNICVSVLVAFALAMIPVIGVFAAIVFLLYRYETEGCFGGILMLILFNIFHLILVAALLAVLAAAYSIF